MVNRTWIFRVRPFGYGNRKIGLRCIFGKVDFLKRPHVFILDIAQHANRACPRRTSGRSLSIDQREEDGG